MNLANITTQLAKIRAQTKTLAPHEIPFMTRLINVMAQTRPYHGLTVYYNAHLTLSSLLQIEALLLSGAELTIIHHPNLHCDKNVLAILAAANLNVVTYDSLQQQHCDIVLDCCAGLLSKVLPKYGVIELTQTGVIKYQQTQVTYPIISIDNSYIKNLETLLGTADGFIRGFQHLTKLGFYNKSFVIFGYGKVGRGLVRALRQFTQQIIIIEADTYSTIVEADFPVYNISDHKQVQAAINNAFCIITATGVKNIISTYINNKVLTKADFTSSFLANMGSEDEWGNGFNENEVLNSKVAINFCLQFPTSLIFLDPIFYSQIKAIDLLLEKNANYQQGFINELPANFQLDVVANWLFMHYPVNDGSDYLKQLLTNIPNYGLF